MRFWLLLLLTPVFASSVAQDPYQYISIKNKYATVFYNLTCTKTPFEFTITLPYKPTVLQWDFNNAAGLNPHANTIINNPVPGDSITVNGKRLYIYRLPGTYLFSSAGVYPVKVFADDPSSSPPGALKEIRLDLPVNIAPVIDWVSTYSGCATDPILFTPVFHLIDVLTIKYSWDFGDNTTDSVLSPMKKYSVPGTYNVKLQAITDVGCISDTIKPIAIRNVPVANFNYSPPTCENKSITFYDSSYSPQAGILKKWYWNFGDGTISTILNNNLLTHVYTTAGNYTVTLTVENDNGCKSIPVSKQITVYISPIAGFSSPGVCLKDPFAQFTDTSKISSATISSWQWNFGDAFSGPLNTSSLQNPKHTYATAGMYDVTLIVTSANGCKDSVTTIFTVNGSQPKAGFNILNNNGLCSNADVQIQNISSVDFGNISKTEVYWDLNGDPSVFDVFTNPALNTIYRHKYPDFQNAFSKTYTIKLKAYSGISCIDETTKIITVNATPSVQFIPIPNTCYNATPFQISQASETSGVPGTGVFTGPGMNGNIFSPAAAGEGTHIIRYTFISNNGCVDYSEQPITVYPVVSVNAGRDTTVLEAATLTLNPAISGNALQYLWTPGLYLNDNTILKPSVTGVNDITYTLTVTGTGGCIYSDDIAVKVLKFPVIPNTFTPNNDGINDTWIIDHISDYKNVRVQVFNRYGQLVYENVGYSKPWDGTMKGRSLPFGTYYYIIEPGNGRQPVTGYVTLIK
jgi:gliding motility-associated-like protein